MPLDKSAIDVNLFTLTATSPFGVEEIFELSVPMMVGAEMNTT